jgi:hypothetical protein
MIFHAASTADVSADTGLSAKGCSPRPGLGIDCRSTSRIHRQSILKTNTSVYRLMKYGMHFPLKARQMGWSGPGSCAEPFTYFILIASATLVYGRFSRAEQRVD